MPPNDRPHLRALTGLRFVAAMQVVLYHVYLPRSAGAPGWVRALVGSGYVGVGLFFVLSGFVLAYNYLQPMAQGRVGRREFWAARFARVYPVYLLGLAAGMPWFVLWMLRVSTPHIAARWVAGVTAACLALVQGWAPQTVCALNCPGWSLSAEAFFYLLFPFLVLPIRRMSARGLAGLCVLAWLLALAAPLAYLALRPDGIAHVGWNSSTAWLLAVKMNPLLRLPEFVIGVAAGRLFLDGAFDRIRSGAVEVAVAAALVAALLASPAVPYLLMHNGLLAPLFAALIVVLAVGRGPVARVLSGRRMEMLGGASYALYILHVPINDWSGRLAARLGVAITWPSLYALVVSLVAIAISLAVFRWIEEPARRALRRRLSRREIPAGGAAIPSPPLAATGAD
ncbi:MAG TPA: acyltransferase [Longimicrobiaceae bacterium]|nr:acyltransferase [Longimicrobiaceae bacterium]